MQLGVQVRHHRVKHWLDQEDVHLMSGRGYRARALAEMANSSTFNYRAHSQELRQASMEASLLSDQEAGPERALIDGKTLIIASWSAQWKVVAMR